MMAHKSASPDQAAGRTSYGWALVVDDHPLFCDALELTLKSVAEFTAVKTADCLEKALTLLQGAEPPSLVILDLNLPDVNGLDGLIRLKRQTEKTPVIIVSSMTVTSSIIGKATPWRAIFAARSFAGRSAQASFHIHSVTWP